MDRSFSLEKCFAFRSYSLFPVFFQIITTRGYQRATQESNVRYVPACNTNFRPRGCSLPVVEGWVRGLLPYYCCCASLSWPATFEAHSRSPQAWNNLFPCYPTTLLTSAVSFSFFSFFFFQSDRSSGWRQKTKHWREIFAIICCASSLD